MDEYEVYDAVNAMIPDFVDGESAEDELSQSYPDIATLMLFSDAFEERALPLEAIDIVLREAVYDPLLMVAKRIKAKILAEQAAA